MSVRTYKIYVQGEVSESASFTVGFTGDEGVKKRKRDPDEESFFTKNQKAELVSRPERLWWRRSRGPPDLSAG